MKLPEYLKRIGRPVWKSMGNGLNQTRLACHLLRLRRFAAGGIWRWRLSWVDLTPRNLGDSIRVSYAHGRYPGALPSEEAIVSGGAVKYQYLHNRMPHAGSKCHILYAVSSSHHPRMNELMRAAQARGIKVVWNQNGAYFPSAYGIEQARKGNALMAPLLHAADYVFYQSQFARESSDYFLGKRHGPSEILYNAVDTRTFSPMPRSPAHDITLLLAGSHNDPYRIPVALETLGILARRGADVRLIIAGSISPLMQKEMMARIARENLTSRVDITGHYSQQSAPEIFRRAHILLHTQYNDVCPSVVIEAMACGLPVVYSQSGGTPELVGAEAGYGVPAVLNWEEAQPPHPEKLAEGVLVIWENWKRYSEAARARAVSRFDLEQWLTRHAQVFEMLLEGTQ